MPVNGLSFRSVCGLFTNVFIRFMAERALRAKQLRAKTIKVRNRLQGLFFVFVASYFLCCGDVHQNPGPRGESKPTDYNQDKSTNESAAESVSTNLNSYDFPPNMAEQILAAIQQQTEKFQSLESNVNQINSNLNDIKKDMGQIKAKCEVIDEKCLRLEREHKEVLETVRDYENKMKTLTNTTNKQLQDSVRLGGRMEVMEREMTSLRDEVDRLEAFSRRDNLRLFGIPEKEGEDYESCARSVCDALNKVESGKTWLPDDFVRAHRVGKGRDGGPKPMIVKFCKWKEKMAIITNREYRDKLQETGVRIANDLTRNQARIAAEARKDGKVVYFKGGKMVVGPKRPDSRTYAQVAKSVTTPLVNEQSSPSSTHRPKRAQLLEGDSPTRDHELDFSQAEATQSSPARETRDSASGSTRQPDIRQYYGGRNERRSPVNPSPRKQVTRRSERNVQTRR